jgi:hypothetical protein
MKSFHKSWQGNPDDVPETFPVAQQVQKVTGAAGDM